MWLRVGPTRKCVAFETNMHHGRRDEAPNTPAMGSVWTPIDADGEFEEE